MRAPDHSGTGKATARLSFDAWADGKVIPTTIELDVLPAKPGPKPEAVTSRISRELIHPNRKGFLEAVQFSPDGKRLLAGDYPGGVIQVWDVATGKQLSKLDTGYETRSGSGYFHVSPDWRTVYVGRSKQRTERTEQDGKKMLRWTFEGDVRAWDLDSGQLRATYQHTPPRYVDHVQLSPDGSSLLTLEEPPGVFVGRPERVATRWDVKTRQPQPIPAGAVYGKFSADGKSVVFRYLDQQGKVAGLKLLDLTTGREKLNVPSTPTVEWVGDEAVLTPDNKFIVGGLLGFATSGSRKHWTTTMKFWDTATGQEAAAIPCAPNTAFGILTFSPDGRLLAATSWLDPQGKLFLFDVQRKQLVKTIPLLSPVDRTGSDYVRAPVFSPDGKWLVVMFQRFPRDDKGAVISEEIRQPRMYLIEAATGEIRETLVMPTGCASLYQSLCFSPDGKTLALAGKGRVYLLDMTKPVGTGENKK